MKAEIMILGKDDRTIQNMASSLSQEEWNVTLASNGEDAITASFLKNFDAVLFTGELAEMEELKLRKVFAYTNQSMLVLKYNATNDLDAFKKGMKEVGAEISKIRKVQNRPVYTITDDALKNARLNIRLS
ncbi:response regulator [Flavitalea flava]